MQLYSLLVMLGIVPFGQSIIRPFDIVGNAIDLGRQVKAGFVEGFGNAEDVGSLIADAVSNAVKTYNGTDEDKIEIEKYYSISRRSFL